jgi:hypothetical protein
MTGGGSDELEVPNVDEGAFARICRRLSSFGRNFRGVWSTEGADAGGLNMIWSC